MSNNLNCQYLMTLLMLAVLISFNQLTSLLDTKQFTRSKPAQAGNAFHTAAQDDWTGDASGVEYHSIISTQNRNNTIGEVQARREADCYEVYPRGSSPVLRCSSSNVLRTMMTLGDETVPLISLERGWSRGLQLRGNSTLHFFFSPDSNLDGQYNHTKITELPEVHNRILYALGLESAPSGGFPEITPYGVASHPLGKSPLTAKFQSKYKQQTRLEQENANVFGVQRTSGRSNRRSDSSGHQLVLVRPESSDTKRFFLRGSGLSSQTILNVGGDWSSNWWHFGSGGFTGSSQVTFFVESAFSLNASNTSAHNTTSIKFDETATNSKPNSLPPFTASIQQTGSPAYGSPRRPTQPSYYVTVKGVDFVSVTDEQGNTNTPIDDTFARSVPNVSYNLLGEKAVLISTPISQTYTMTFQVGASPLMVRSY